MFVQNFIKLSIAVRELPCAQRNKKAPAKAILSITTADSIITDSARCIMYAVRTN